MNVRSYDEAVEFLNGARYPQRGVRTIANNTRVKRYFDVYAVELHKTDVVVFAPSIPVLGIQERITLAAGGWYTDTTMRRIEEHTPFTIYRDNTRWRVSYSPLETELTSVPFNEGLTFERTDHGWQPRENLLSREVLRLQDTHNAKIRSLIKQYTTMRRRDTVNCALCVLHPRTGQLAGDVIGDTQHLIEHLVDGVCVPQMYTSAGVEAGLAAEHAEHYLKPRMLRAFLETRLLVGAVAGRTGRRPQGEIAWALAQRQMFEKRRARRLGIE